MRTKPDWDAIVRHTLKFYAAKKRHSADVRAKLLDEFAHQRVMASIAAPDPSKQELEAAIIAIESEIRTIEKEAKEVSA